MKWILGIAVAVLLVGGLAYASLTTGVVVQAAAAKREAIREFVDEQAQTRLPLTHLITMPYDGRIDPITLPEGAKVTKSQLVAQVVPLDTELTLQEAQANISRLDASIKESGDKTVEKTGLKQSLEYVASMQATVAAAEARVEAGLAKLDYANKNLRRIRALRETNSASEDQLNSAEVQQVQADVDYRQDQLVLKALQSMMAATVLVPTVVEQYMARKDLSVAVLENEKRQAEVRLRRDERDRTRGQMTSPVDGVVLERLETNERSVAAGTVLLKIGDLEQLEIEADILSQDVVRVRAGQAVEIYGPAVGPAGARGKVAKIYPAGFTKVSSLGVEQQRVKVVVSLDEGELRRLEAAQPLGVGYRVRVRIFTAEAGDAVVVPRSALFRGPDGSWQVYAIRGGRTRLANVKVGLMNDERVQILEGVNDGEQVVLAPESTLVDGTRATPAEN